MTLPAIGIDFTGLVEVKKQLGEFNKRYRRQVIKPATTAALRPIAKEAKRLCDVKSISRLIKSEAFISKKKGRVTGKVFVREHGSRNILIDGREVDFAVAGNILEFGSEKQNIRPRAFMRGARASKQAEAMKVMESKIDELSQKLIRKVGK